MARSSRTVISRRAVLRGMVGGGVSVAVPLPRLIGMLNDNGTAYAAGGPLPVRVGNWVFGNGIIPSRWVPAETGGGDRKSTRPNSSHQILSYSVLCFEKKKKK